MSQRILREQRITFGLVVHTRLALNMCQVLEHGLMCQTANSPGKGAWRAARTLDLYIMHPRSGGTGYQYHIFKGVMWLCMTWLRYLSSSCQRAHPKTVYCWSK